MLCSPFNHFYCIRPDTKYTTLDKAVLLLPLLVFLQKGNLFLSQKRRKILSIYHLPSFCLQTDSLLVYCHYPLLSPYFFLAISFCFCCCYCWFLKNAVSFFFFGYKFIASHHLMIISSHHLSHNSCQPKPQQHLHQTMTSWS